MVKIRLLKTGVKHKKSFRIVATDSQNKRDGKFLELIGFYDPKTKPPTIKIDKKKLSYWLSRGAQSTEAVKNLIDNEKAS